MEKRFLSEKSALLFELCRDALSMRPGTPADLLSDSLLSGRNEPLDTGVDAFAPVRKPNAIDIVQFRAVET